MKIINGIVNAFVRRVTLSFTLIVLSFTFIGKFANVEEYFKGLAVSELISFFWFSCLLALSFGIADFIKKNVIIKRTVQFVLTYLSVVVIFFCGTVFKNMLATVQNPAFTVVSVTFAFVVVYSIIAFLVLLTKFVMNKILNSKKEYTGMFNNVNK